MSVQEYLEKHQLSRKVEEAVNAAVRAKVPNPALFVAGHMRRAAPAVITRVRARPRAPPPARAGKRRGRRTSRQGCRGRGVRVINDKVLEALVGMDPQHQAQIDQAIMDFHKVPLYRHIADLVGNSTTMLPVPAITVIKRAVNEYTCNALVLKANQIGTVTEAIEVVKQAKDVHWGVIVSHRFVDTEDSFTADFAVGAAA